MAKRQLSDWLSSYLEYTDISESPLSYHTWSGLSMIASAMQRKVYMKWGASTIYPNMYIILIGPSGRGRKGEPIDIARWMLEELNLNIVEEDITQEALIVEMKNAEISFLDTSTSKWVIHSPVTVCAEELAVFTGYQNGTFMAYLTNWFDSRPKWSRRTKGQGSQEVLGLCFNMLASTAPDWLPHILTKESIGGGFTSRCIFVVEQKKRKTVALPKGLDEKLRAKLLHDLEMIQYMNGRFEFTEEAKNIYADWYTAEDIKLEEGHKIFSNPALAGYGSRRATHIKKLCMCIAASEGETLVITANIFKRALTLMEGNEDKMGGLFGGFGKARYAEETEKVLQYLEKHKTVTRTQIMRTFYRDIDEMSLESIITVLTQMHVIDVKILSATNDREYTYVGDDNA